ncbi:unnamed protein product [Caenorhabditis nigoni]
MFFIVSITLATEYLNTEDSEKKKMKKKVEKKNSSDQVSIDQTLFIVWIVATAVLSIFLIAVLIICFCDRKRYKEKIGHLETSISTMESNPIIIHTAASSGMVVMKNEKPGTVPPKPKPESRMASTKTKKTRKTESVETTQEGDQSAMKSVVMATGKEKTRTAKTATGGTKEEPSDGENYPIPQLSTGTDGSYSLHSLLIILFITTISSADNSTTPESSSTTDTASSTTDAPETSTISSTTYPPCLIPIENRIYMGWITFYTLLFLIFALTFLVFIFLILWIRDTEKLKKRVKELEKKIQDMEQYGVMKPNPPKQVIQSPKRSDKKESKIVKVVDEVKSGEKTETPQKKKTTKRSAKKKKENKKNDVQTPLVSVTEETITCSKDSTDTRTTEATTEESKTQLESKTETSVIGTVVETDRTQEKSPIDSIATAEVNILSRKVY